MRCTNHGAQLQTVINNLRVAGCVISKNNIKNICGKKYKYIDAEDAIKLASVC